MQHLKRIIVLLLFCFTLISAKQINKDDNSWKYMVFTQTWSAASCMEFNNEHRSCDLNKKYNEWSIHGIWPNNEDKTGPFYCDESWKFDERKIKDIESQLDEKWPNILDNTPHTNFWKHEWEKHGTCAASLSDLNTEHKYFSMGLHLNQVWNLTSILGSAGIIPSEKVTYQLNDIEKVIESRTKSAVNIGCVQLNGIQTLVQVEICLNKQFHSIDCDDSHANKHGKLLWYPNMVGVHPCDYDAPTSYVIIN